ncbi:MAG: hypothetical protein QM719_12915 [Thermomonas sp.]
MHADFFFDLTAGDLDANSVAAATFSLLGVSEFERRESENYLAGEYFCAISGGLTFEVSINEYSDGSLFRYWLSIEDFENLNEDDFERKISSALNKMQQRCDRVARVHDFGKKTMRVITL